ncbi:MAG: hypothetical protein Ct9H300mP25_01460 [Acidobacteriota bacterium]|nr:MAG: hypothetical protein Ct9H300mP25_01460 [Acidobacteriota bacterium]
MHVAIFSPLPPQRSGIAHYTSELLPLLSREHEIDLYTDCIQPDSTINSLVNVFDAHDFIWRRKQTSYDHIIYQLGNATCHDYMWPYLAHYPGHIVLHDGHVHHSRARSLLSQKRYDAYRAEFAFSHSDCPTDVAELGVQGLLGNLTYFWPMLGVPMAVARSVSVHNSRLAENLQHHYSHSTINTIRMGVSDPTTAIKDSTRHSTRNILGFSSKHVVFAAYGGLTPEKRIPQILRAVKKFKGQTHPLIRLLLVGNPATHYDARADAHTLGIEHLVTFTNYVADADLPKYLAAADVYLCLRWPSTGETSASMIRCLAMGNRSSLRTSLSTETCQCFSLRGHGLYRTHGRTQSTQNLSASRSTSSMKITRLKLHCDDCVTMQAFASNWVCAPVNTGKPIIDSR